MLLHLIYLGMQNNMCGPSHTIKDIGSGMCVCVHVCVCVCRHTTKADGMRGFRII